MYLLDTNVVSELRKVGTGKADPAVVAWARAQSNHLLFLSAISVMELEIGILQIQRRDATQGLLLRTWFNSQVLPEFQERILPIDTEVALHCAKLHVPAPRSERDALIAATALVHNLTVVTRNIADFKASGVATLNPWLVWPTEDES